MYICTVKTGFMNICTVKTGFLYICTDKTGFLYICTVKTGFVYICTVKTSCVHFCCQNWFGTMLNVSSCTGITFQIETCNVPSWYHSSFLYNLLHKYTVRTVHTTNWFYLFCCISVHNIILVQWLLYKCTQY